MTRSYATDPCVAKISSPIPSITFRQGHLLEAPAKFSTWLSFERRKSCHRAHLLPLFRPTSSHTQPEVLVVQGCQEQQSLLLYCTPTVESHSSSISPRIGYHSPAYFGTLASPNCLYAL